MTGILFEVAALQRAHDEMRRRGGHVVDPIEKRPWGVSYFTVADPGGNELPVTNRAWDRNRLEPLAVARGFEPERSIPLPLT